MPAVARTSCPQCEAALAPDPRYSAWCPACGWNADPQSAPPPDAAAARRRRRALRSTAADLARARRSGPRSAVRARRAALLLALPLLVPSALLVALAVLVLTADADLFWKVTVTAGCVLGLRAVTPRPARTPSGPGVLTRDDAPAIFAVLGTVAGRLGARVPAAVVAEESTISSSVRTLSGTVLRVGVLEWNVLDGRQRLALLTHLLAHDVSGDPREQPVVAFALGTRALWLSLLKAGPPSDVSRTVLASDHVILYTGHAYRPGDGRVLNGLARGLLGLFAAGVRGLGAPLLRVVGPAAVAAELRADALAARVAGPDPVVGWLRTGLLGPQVHQAYLTARNRGDVDVWSGQLDLFSRIPGSEVDRAERRAREDGLVATDEAHPPTHLRLDVLREPREQGEDHDGDRVAVTPDAFRAVDAELRRGLRETLTGRRRD